MTSCVLCSVDVRPARTPRKTGLLQLASADGLHVSSTSSVIDRITTSAGEFKKLAKDFAIRPATRGKIAKAIEENRKRMA